MWIVSQLPVILHDTAELVAAAFVMRQIWLARAHAKKAALVSESTDSKVDIANKNLENLKGEINGRMSELLEVTKSEAHAAGVLDEKDRR